MIQNIERFEENEENISYEKFKEIGIRREF
jgi:hypothetical protein